MHNLRDGGHEENATLGRGNTLEQQFLIIWLVCVWPI